MEIDTNGIMWVIDGVRFKYNTDCPCKLVLLDLNRNGKVVHTYTFPKDVCLQDGGYLNDIVLDGDYAYMTDTSFIDPGLIIYSKLKNKSWKLRDSSMFQERKAPKFSIDDNPVKIKASIDGIALSPKPVSESKSRKLFYSSVTGYSLFSIKTKYLKNEEMYKNGTFRNKIRLIGKKQGATDGMIVDSKGNLF
ncbi:hypothetical protein JTB14_034657 [Gonioctena quinquepunctata]|nr:hypothetical protein JTB14_034657 [Gonioctena quinquepunctata]